MSLATRCPACGTIFRVVQDQLKVSEGWVRCGQCHEVFHGIEALFDLDSDPAIAARRAAARPPAAPPPTRVFAEQRANAPIPAPVSTPPSPIAIPARPSATVPPAAPRTVPATPSAFGSSGFPPAPPPIRPGYTGFTPAARPMQPPPPPPPAPLPPPAPTPIQPVATRGTIAPRFAARLAEEAAARGQAPAPTPIPAAFAPTAPVELDALPALEPAPEPARAQTPLVTPIPEPSPAPSAAELASEFAAPAPQALAPEPISEPAPAASPEVAPVPEDAVPLSRPVDDDEARAGPPTLASMLPEDAGEWPPKRTKRRAAEPASASTEVALVDKTKDPRFLREARSGARWRRPWVRAALSVALLLLIVAAAGQVAWPMRDTLAARWPVTRPAWDWLCEQAECRIEAPRAIASLALDGSSLTRTDTEHVLLFSADLHNRADHEVRVPSFDVTFMDLNGEIVARKVLTPEQIGIHQASLPAEGELHVHARLQVGTLPASGFQADLFYP
ncbi:DUF3426 domain-containing protein [Scleromatobacter humisilvae]|uniref:DUF3426 domain-containing protein n=1 Tax=Scleromatobacter humisilvae TaxID=2897159 RepID=A0A9X1YSJ9_9BURK|nr:DUF3426 domain-containing protein [Scleromatobacter humisilvae]MCK9688461.1 DUF3426 domain-containing protein [Scleromatobacter humisilvae]